VLINSITNYWTLLSVDSTVKVLLKLMPSYQRYPKFLLDDVCNKKS